MITNEPRHLMNQNKTPGSWVTWALVFNVRSLKLMSGIEPTVRHPKEGVTEKVFYDLNAYCTN